MQKSKDDSQSKFDYLLERRRLVREHTERYAIGNDLYTKYSRFRVATAELLKLYANATNRDESAYGALLEAMSLASRKVEQLEIFLSTEKEWLDRQSRLSEYYDDGLG